MTDIALRADTYPVPAAAPSRLTEWSHSAREASHVAVSLAKTPFVPQSLRDRDEGVTAANITAAILTGQELGLEPMASLRSVDIIQGTPALRAVALRAIVLAAGHELVLTESTETRAVVKGRRRGSDQWQESKWTIDRAQKLNLIGKDNWRKQPGAMLIARATAECARLIAADALLGVPYSSEELADEGLAGMVDATVTAIDEPKRTARRRTSPARQAQQSIPQREVSEPGPEPEFDEPEPDHSTAETITDAQMKKLHAMFRENDLDRDAALAYVSNIVGEDVTTTKDLTKQQASAVIDSLTPDEDDVDWPESSEVPA